MCNDFFNTYLIKTIGIVCLGIVFYVMSFIFKHLLKVDNSFKVAVILGGLSILIAYIMAGCNQILGTWFSIDGDGVQIFLASIAFLVMFLSILTAVLLHSYQYINLTFIAILVGVFHLLTFFKLDYQISLIIIGCLLLVCNLFKFNKYIYNFSSVAVFIFTVLSIIFGFENNFLLGSLVLVINAICILSVLAKNKGFLIEFFSLISFIALIISFVNFKINFGLLTVILTLIVCVFELAINTFKLVKNDALSVISKIICFFILIGMAIDENVSLVSQVVVFMFLLVTTVSNSYIIKHDHTEKYLLPVKLAFIIGCLFDAINYNLTVEINSIYLFGGLSLIYLFVYKVLNKRNCSEKVGYLIINFIWLICVFASLEMGILDFIFAILVILINYIGFDHKDNVVVHRLFYTFILFLLLAIGGFEIDGIIPTVVVITILSILAFLNYKDKYNYSATVILLYTYFIDLIDLIVVNGVLLDVLSSIFFLTLLGISSEVLFKTAKSKNIFLGILITLELLSLFENVFIINIYSLIVSLIIILISLKNDDYKALYYIGLILGSLNLVSLISFLGGLPTSVYLFIIAIVLIIIVSIMIYRYQHREIKVPNNLEEKVEVTMDTINYCPECGKKIQSDERFCGNCGTKVK